MRQSGASSEFPEPLRALIDQSVSRLVRLCTNSLYRKYPRLTRAPLNLQAEELLSAVVERLLKSLREVRPTSVRQFFGIANQHIRWQLNEFARSIANRELQPTFDAELQVAGDSTGSQLSDTCKRILAAIDELPIEQQEAFDLVRIQGLSVAECAEILEVSEMTVRRRIHRALTILSTKIDLPARPDRA
ncbi:RNA polymerase sigma factor [Pirellulaceae bacterium SH467]